ncbi:hypothetical protein PCANB_002198 [Pneumocystis canis]|nr:hypothetical protein PCK1_001858 [Pneumocystis canis]KAG5439621.1 hypothetical protein PCANB_002198 [Pneumocystis canis]
MKKRIQHDNEKEYVKKKCIQSNKYSSFLSENINNDYEKTHSSFESPERLSRETSAKIYLKDFISLQNDTLSRIKCLVESAKENSCKDDHKFKVLLNDLLVLEGDMEQVSNADTLKDDISLFLSILIDHRIALEHLINAKCLDIRKYKDEHEQETDLAKTVITNIASNTFSQMNQSISHKKNLKKLIKAMNLALLTFPPYKTITVILPNVSTVKDLKNYLLAFFPSGNYILSHLSGKLLQPEESLASLLNNYQYSNGGNLCIFRCVPRVLGGKGGFGSQLRAAGGRMSSRKKRGQEENKLAKYLETASLRKYEILEERKQKLRAIIDAKPFSEKIIFDDNEFLEKNEMLIDDVKNAVKLVMIEKSKLNSKTALKTDSTNTDCSLDFKKENDTNSTYLKLSDSLSNKINKRYNKWDQEDSVSSDDNNDF